MIVLTREQLEERLAALHKASLELVGDLSLDVVLQRIVELAREQAGARYAALGVVDEKGALIRFIPVGMGPEVLERMEHPPVGKGMIGALMRERKTICIPEISEDPRSVGFPEHHPLMHPFLGVPIMLGERLLGLIYLTDKIDTPEFTQTDERVIETLAAYAAIAINNAHLYQGMEDRDHVLRQRNEDLALVDDLAAAMASSLEVDQILQKTLTRIMEYLNVETGEIFLGEESGQTFSRTLHLGEAVENFFTRDLFLMGEGPVGMVAESGRPLLSFYPGKEIQYFDKEVSEKGFCCLVCIPMTSRNQVVGVLCLVSRQSDHLDERAIDLLTSIGTWAGLTIENARLHRQAQRLAVLEERERIGMDLHDGIIQSIYGVGLALDYAQLALNEDPVTARAKIEQAVDGLNNTIRDIRSYILDLRPRQFRGEDLMVGLKQLIDEFSANSAAKVNLIGPKNGLVGLPTQNATALFHICQEALANVAKHSRAKDVIVHMWPTSDRVILEIVDNGRGFDLRKMSVTLGHGLSNMHSRAHKVGGDVEITAEPGDGTTILAWVPRKETLPSE
jgi:two-component system, NarL family, sensor histidine kinase DevS